MKENTFLWYVKDLFNLKTSTMRKLLILSTPLFIGLLLFSLSIEAQDKQSDMSLIGKWQLCDKDSLVSTNVDGKKGISRYKIISENTFVVVEIKNDDETFLGDFIGSYTIEGNLYTDNIQYTTHRLKALKGITNSFEFEIKNDLLFIKGTNNIYDEIWRKIE